jgi:hypothetical protein
MIDRHRSLVDSPRRLEFLWVQRWQIGMGAQSGDIDAGGIRRIENGGALGRLDLHAVDGKAHHECEIAPGVQAVRHGRGGRLESGLHGAQEYLIFLR